jgi:hypothetical protein
MSAIEARPDRWDQARFLGLGVSGPVLCFAGWTCFLAGYDVEEMLLADPDRCGGIVVGIAQTLLGLSESQAAVLFSYSETATDRHPTVREFKTVVTEITGVTFDV